MPVRVRGSFLVALLAVAGCSGSVGQPTGRVTLRGVAVSGAELTFLPAADPDVVATGVTDREGNYRLDYGGKRGVAAGKATVRVVFWTLPNGKPLPSGEEGAALKADETKALRTSYLFETDVAVGDGTLDFELSEGKRE
ncbi:MAG TPA: hypothetical protein VM597_19385 [Gemmataceae bacterium]|jgi:hypothetical protein|nr:hypothetical protein [Gemmataceae bacterium]